VTTLRDLEYQIAANTDGLNKAFPVLDKLVKSLEKLETTVEKLAQSYDQSMNQMARSTVTAQAATTRSANSNRQSMRKQADAVKDMKVRVDELNARLRTNNLTSWMGGTTRSFTSFERAMKSGTLSAYDFQRAKKRLTDTLGRANTALRETERNHRAAASAVRMGDTQMIRQENTVDRLRHKYEDTQAALQKYTRSMDPAIMQRLHTAFQQLNTDMTAGPMSARRYAAAQRDFNNVIRQTYADAKVTHPILRLLGSEVDDLTKAVQVALGPLSGVASRITATAALFKTNAAAIAFMISGIIALGVGFGMAVNAGAQWEQELLRIDAVLKATGRSSDGAADTLDRLAGEIGRLTSATDNQARAAIANLLTLDNVTSDLYKGALLAAQGLSLIGRGTLESQIRRVGKALDDPINNLTELGESGVFFNATEKETIEILQRSGKLHDAQALVMAKLSDVTAAATGETGGLMGAWHRLTESLDDFLTESVAATGVLTTLTAGLNELTEDFEQLNRDMDLARNIGSIFYYSMVILGGVLKVLATHLDTVLMLLGGFITLKIATWVLAAVKNFRLLISAMGMVAAQAAIMSRVLGATYLGLAAAAVMAITRIVTSQKILSAETSTFANEHTRAFDQVRKNYEDSINATSRFGSFLDEVLNSTVLVFGKSVNEMRFDRVMNNLHDLMENVTGLVQSRALKFINAPELNPSSQEKLKEQYRTLVQAIVAMQSEFLRAAREGTTPDIDPAPLENALRVLETIGLEPTIENVKQLETVMEALNREYAPLLEHMRKTGTIADSLNAPLRQALDRFTQMRDQFMPFIKDEKLAGASITDLTDNIEKMREALRQTGDLEGLALLDDMQRVVEENGTAARKFVSDLGRQTKAMERSIKIAGALGKELYDLTLAEEINQNVLSQFPTLGENWRDTMKFQSEEIRKQIEAIIALTTAMAGFRQQAAQVTMQKDLTEELARQSSELGNIGKSDRERAIIAAELAKKQEMLNNKVEEGSESWKEQLRIVRQLVEVDFATQQEEALIALRDNVKVLERGVSTARGLTAIHDEEIAQLRDRLELERQYGKASEEELQLRKQIRTLERAEAQEQSIKALGDEIFLLEKQVQLGNASTAVMNEQVAQWRDMIELANTYGVISEEELQRRQKIRQLNMLVQHNAEIKALQTQLSLQDALVESYFQSETTQRHMLALRQKELELIEKYGSMQDPMAQREMALFKAIQDRVAWIERNLAPIADAFDSMFQSMEDGLVEFLSTGKMDVVAWGQSLAEDVFRTMYKSLVTDPLKDALGGMLSNFLKGGLPSIPGLGGGLGELGTMNNPMWVRVSGGIPGLGGAANPLAAATALTGTAATAATAAAAVPAGVTGAGSAVDTATQLIGLNESANTAQINSFLKAGGVDINSAQTAWCAAFVKSSLAQVGIDAQGATLTATSFLNVGTAVKPEDVLKGDILVQARGLAAGQSGGHVGFATGATRMAESGLQLEMLGGNQGPTGMGGVSKQWIDAAELNVQRLTASTESLAGAQTAAVTSLQTVPGAANSLTSSVNTLATGAVPATTQAMQQMTTSGVVSATTGMTTTGTAALTTAASLNALGAAAGGAAISAQAQAAMAAAPMGGLWHEGGVVGAGGALTSMWTGGFSGPRLAKGLMPDEFRAVLHRNEAVFNEDQLNALGNGLRARNEFDDDGQPSMGGENHFHFHGVKDVSGFNKSKSQMAAWAAQANRKADYYEN